jgi:hypothetical protein
MTINCSHVLLFNIKLSPYTEGFSILGVAHWNKFHASVLMNRRLMEKVGGQGLTLVHFSAQPQPFWSHLPVSPCLIDWGKILHPT